MVISGRVHSKIFGLHGTHPCHKCGICTHGVVFIRWAYLLDTALEPKAAKHGPLNKNHLVETHFLGNTPRKKQKRGCLEANKTGWTSAVLHSIHGLT